MSPASFLFLAADVIDEVKPAQDAAGKTLIPGIGDVFLVVAVCAAIALGVLFWAVFLRRGSNRETLRTAPVSSGKRKRKRKVRFMNRNPTLAETGGLPPMREDSPGGSAD